MAPKKEDLEKINKEIEEAEKLAKKQAKAEKEKNSFTGKLKGIFSSDSKEEKVKYQYKIYQ